MLVAVPARMSGSSTMASPTRCASSGLAMSIAKRTAAAVLGLVVPDVRVVDVATTDKTLPGFAARWLEMLGR